MAMSQRGVPFSARVDVKMSRSASASGEPGCGSGGIAAEVSITLSPK